VYVCIRLGFRVRVSIRVSIRVRVRIRVSVRVWVRFRVCHVPDTVIYVRQVAEIAHLSSAALFAAAPTAADDDLLDFSHDDIFLSTVSFSNL